MWIKGVSGQQPIERRISDRCIRTKGTGRMHVLALSRLGSGMRMKGLTRTWRSLIRTLYVTDKKCRTSTSLFKEAADLYVQLEDFASAIGKYEKVADIWLKSPLSKFGVREIWLKQGVCALANNVCWPCPMYTRRNSHIIYTGWSNSNSDGGEICRERPDVQGNPRITIFEQLD